MKSIRIDTTRCNTEVAEDEVAIVIDKTSRLKNPFYLRDESEREKNIAQYRAYFYEKVKTDAQFKAELDRLAALNQNKNLVLKVWCHPKPTFADVIAQWLRQNGG